MCLISMQKSEISKLAFFNLWLPFRKQLCLAQINQYQKDYQAFEKVLQDFGD